MRKKDISKLRDAELYQYRHEQDEKLFGEYMNKLLALEEREVYEKKNYLRGHWFRIRDESTKGLMDFPTHEVKVGEDTCLVYDIPPERMQEALDKANPYKGALFFPVRYCNFGKAVILYAFGYNFIVKPTFFTTGETADGWGLMEEELIMISNMEKEGKTFLPKPGCYVSNK